MSHLYSTGPLANGTFTIATRTHTVFVNLLNNDALPTSAVVTVWDLGQTPKAMVETQTVVLDPLEAQAVTVTGLEGVERFEVQTELPDDSSGNVRIAVFGATVDDTVTLPVPIHRLVSAELTPMEPPFTPRDIPGLMAWYDAEQLNSSEGAPVSEWPDASGNGHHAEQADPALQPIFREGVLNSRPVVEFRMDFLRTSLFHEAEGQPITAFAVWRLIDGNVPGAASFRRVFDGVSADFGLEWRATVPTGIRMAAPQGILNARGPVETFIVNSCIFERTHSELYENSVRAATGNVGSASLDGITIGARHNDARKLMGQIAELIFYERALAQEEREQLERYLQAKWGISPPNSL